MKDECIVYTHGIIIPFRKREDHLKQSAPILKRYGKVYVIEQMDKLPFNRGKLINAGYLTFRNEFNYFTAHDVDLIPEKRVDYSYSPLPCHLAAEIQHLNYHLPYEKYFGGVTLMPNHLFEKINGFPNDYNGWGGEDDQLRKRFVEMHIDVTRRPGRYLSLPHIRKIDKDLRQKNKDANKEPVRWGNGLTSCKFDIIGRQEKEHYTLIQVVI